MGCLKLHIETEPILRLAYSKKHQKPSKKVGWYYPFGLKHKGYNNVVNGVHHPYGYNGKEENDELGLEWLDFGARNYDASLGRWMNLDPLTEEMSSHSPYNYAFNNPVFFIDPDGMAPISGNDDYIISSTKISNSGSPVKYSNLVIGKNAHPSLGYHTHTLINSANSSNFSGSQTDINLVNTSGRSEIGAGIVSTATGMTNSLEKVNRVDEISTSVDGTYFNSDGDAVENIEDATSLVVNKTTSTTSTKFDKWGDAIKGGTTVENSTETTTYDVKGGSGFSSNGGKQLKNANTVKSKSTIRTVNFSETSVDFQKSVNNAEKSNNKSLEKNNKTFQKETKKALKG